MVIIFQHAISGFQNSEDLWCRRSTGARNRLQAAAARATFTPDVKKRYLPFNLQKLSSISPNVNIRTNIERKILRRGMFIYPYWAHQYHARLRASSLPNRWRN
jgi:hypothetical protein